MRDGPDGRPVESTRNLAELTAHVPSATWDIFCAWCPRLEPAPRVAQSSPYVVDVVGSITRTACCRDEPATKPSLWRRLTRRT